MKIIIGSVIQIAIFSLLGAVFLRAAAKWVLKKDVIYSVAYGTVFLAGLANTIIGFLLDIAIGLISSNTVNNNHQPEILFISIILPISILVSGAIIAHRLSVNFKKALLTASVMIGAVIGISMAGGLVVLVATKLLGGT
jgi:hypothetical protein